MGRVPALTLLLALAASGQGNSIASFRLKSDPDYVERGWVVEYDADGFVFERFGRARKLHIKWTALVDKDAETLRRRFGLTGPDEEGRIDGVRLHFHGGLTAEGVLVRMDQEGRHWLQSGGLLLPYPQDRVAKVEQIKVAESNVYDETQLYYRRLQSNPPRGAKGQRALADYAFEVGEFRKAQEHYQSALRLRPDWRPQLAGRLAELDGYLRDARIEKELGIVKRAMRIERDFDRARRRLDGLLEDYPGRRSLIRVQDQLARERVVYLQRRFHRVKDEEFRRVVRGYLTRSRPGIDEAMSWARSKLGDLIKEAVRKRMGLTRDELKQFLETRAKGSAHWASYWSGSFVLSRRAKRGPWSRKTIQGDPNRWWFTYSQAGPRGNFLRAYAAERLPDLFEVVQIRLPRCEKCGGTGLIRHVSLRGLKALDAGHEWKQVCPRCYGARVDRVVGYR